MMFGLDVYAIVAGIIAVLGMIFGIYRAGKKAGKSEDKLDAYEKHLERVKRAADARDAPRVPAAKDRYNRD